ncbi:helix-turn-helix domain-containing protein [uncultured Kordia sp.]|uniref:helix-turn-helix domain-containing protein n=1 Tax=uncultured Kordia sp. TaxID=507699 RepID=UPI00260FBA20|nr:helix-turn-helix domain-containing protein [uncultured Kordia sp.]
MLLLQKRIPLLLFVFFLCCSQKVVSSTVFQDTVPQFNAEEFKASFQKMSPKDFAFFFRRECQQDSLKVSICLKHIENIMLQSEDLLTQFWGNYAIAHWYNDKLDFERSIIYADKLYEIAEELNSSDLKLTTFINKGNFYYDYGKYRESMESYLEAIQFAKEVKDLGRQLVISHNIALLKIDVGDYKGAVELLEGTLKIIEEQEPKRFKRLEVSIYIALAKSYMRLENYTKAEYYGNIGIELSDKYMDEDAKAYLYNYLGEIYLAQKKYQKTLQLLNKASNYANTIQTSSSQLTFINLNIAKTLYYQKKYNKSIAILEKIAVNQQQKKTNFFSLEDMYKYLGKSYKEIGDTEKSLLYFEKANEVYALNDKKQNQIGIEIIKEYDLQSLKTELNQAEQQTLKTKITLYISIFLALLIIVGLIYVYKRREKDNQQKFSAILQSLEEEKEKMILAQQEIAEKAQSTEILTKKETIKEAVLKEVEIIDETKARLLKKLENFETKELYLSKNSSLNEVAKKLKTNTSYLSKLVNAHKGKSFSAYITDLRINYAIRRLKEDKKFRSYTIDSIAREIGFNRSESFSKAFKNKTGLYPSYYIKNLDNQGIE